VNSLNLLPREMFHLDHVDSSSEMTGFLWQKSIKYHQATEPNGIYPWLAIKETHVYGFEYCMYPVVLQM